MEEVFWGRKKIVVLFLGMLYTYGMPGIKGMKGTLQHTKPEWISEWQRLYQGGKSLTEIAIGYPVSRAQIHRHLQKTPGLMRSAVNVGVKNGMWKEKPGIVPLHLWARRWIPKPDKCQKCGKPDNGKKWQMDLANIGHKYERNLTDWIWLCRKCHIRIDGRLEPFLMTKNKTKK